MAEDEHPAVTNFREYIRIKTVQPNPDYGEQVKDIPMAPRFSSYRVAATAVLVVNAWTVFPFSIFLSKLGTSVCRWLFVDS